MSIPPCFYRWPKCATTFTSSILAPHALVEVVQPAHVGASMVPPSGPLLGLLRDPWSWYVSFLQNMEDAPLEPLYLRRLALGAQVDKAAALFKVPAAQIYYECVGLGCGLWSWVYLYMYFPEEVRRLTLTEILERHDELAYPGVLVYSPQVRQGLGPALRSLKVPLPRAKENGLSAAPRRNASAQREALESYYSQALLDLIDERDGPLVRHYGLKLVQPVAQPFWEIGGWGE